MEVVKEVPGKNYVTDPTTGKVVSAPEYGGTLTVTYGRAGDNQDPFFAGLEAAWLIDGVNEKLAYGDWGTNRGEFEFGTPYVPTSVFRGILAESWEQTDPLTYVFHIRPGVHYALNPDSEASRLVNGRELTARDIEHTYHRYLGLGSGFTEPSPLAVNYGFAKEPWESIEATDDWTLVVKTTRPSPSALRTFIANNMNWILPPEVIEQYGDYSDWKNVVGTGPMMLTDWTEGSSITWEKSPDYWGYDEKYPDNRLPYIDKLRALVIPEVATRVAALRSGKVAYLGSAGSATLRSIDTVAGLGKTNPELVIWPSYGRSENSFGLNVNNPPFDDLRVRQAMQMALDLETMNDGYFKGYGETTPQGHISRSIKSAAPNLQTGPKRSR